MSPAGESLNKRLHIILIYIYTLSHADKSEHMLRIVKASIPTVNKLRLLYGIGLQWRGAKSKDSQRASSGRG